MNPIVIDLNNPPPPEPLKTYRLGTSGDPFDAKSNIAAVAYVKAQGGIYAAAGVKEILRALQVVQNGTWVWVDA